MKNTSSNEKILSLFQVRPAIEEKGINIKYDKTKNRKVVRSSNKFTKGRLSNKLSPVNISGAIFQNVNGFEPGTRRRRDDE